MNNATKPGSLSVLVVVCEGCLEESVGEHVRRVISHWTEARLPELAIHFAQRVVEEPTLLKGHAAIWVWSRSANGEAEGLNPQVLAEIEELGIPTMLSQPGQTEADGTVYQHGTIFCSPQAEPSRACMMLQALCSQSPVISGLQGELSALRSAQGGLADQIGKMDEELRLASQLQREFLPESMPTLHGVEFDALWRPASYVSGDIYDVSRLDEDHIGFFVADAVGHGVPAALLTMFVKRSLKTKIIDADRPGGYRLAEPAEALDRLNRDLVARQSANARFVTACYGVIHCRTRRVRLARAGHPYPLVISPDGNRRTLAPEGGLLGIFDEAVFDQVEVDLAEHDRLVVYSDGFELAFPDEPLHCGKIDEAGHYTEQFSPLAGGALHAGLAQLEAKVDHQSGSLNQQDDLTILCLDAGPGEAGNIDLRAEASTPAAEQANVAHSVAA